MWFSLRDAAGNFLGKEDLIHTGWNVTENGFENADTITIVIGRSGTASQGLINLDDGAVLATVKISPVQVRQGQEIDFTAGALVIFGKAPS